MYICLLILGKNRTYKIFFPVLLHNSFLLKSISLKIIIYFNLFPILRPQECSNSDRPQQIVHVSLHKDPVYEDFGFSVSDGLYERGVYINRLRPGGPCDGVLKPYDRILRVNEASTEDCDCCLAVPLIAAAGPRLDLTVARPVSPPNIIKTL